MKYILAIDQSTSATKLMLFDEQEKLCGRVSLDHQQFYPQLGWVEHDAHEIMQNVYVGAAQLLEKTGINKNDVVSVAITNQRETVVVWEAETSQCVYPAVVWQCQRGADYCRQWKQAGLTEKVQAKTGLLIDPYFSVSGLRWILDNVPGAREKAEAGALRMGTMDTWMLWNLTGGRVHATDQTNASRTMLYNIHTLAWDEELLEDFKIPASLLPEVLPCDAVFGETDFNGLFDKPIPVAGILGDSHAALVGQACFQEGLGKATYGTGSSVMVNIGDKSHQAPEGLVTSVAFAAMGKTFYAFEGNIHCTGATIKWMVDDLQLIDHASETEALARSVEDNGGVHVVPAFAELRAYSTAVILPCSGFAPDSLVQQNKNACPLIVLRVAHLPQNKPVLSLPSKSDGCLFIYLNAAHGQSAALRWVEVRPKRNPAVFYAKYVQGEYTHFK